MITGDKFFLLVDDAISDEKLFSLITEIDLPQRLSWLYIIANVRDNDLLDEFDRTLALPEGQQKYKLFDIIFTKAEQIFNASHCAVNSVALAEDIVEITHYIAGKIRWGDLNFAPEHPHYIRADYLAPGLQKITSVQDVCHALTIPCMHCTPDSALITINGCNVTITPDDDNYADLRLEEGQRSADIALNAADFTCLTPREALELAHEIGHCRNHLTSPDPDGDFALPFWDTELPAFEEERRLCVSCDPHLDLRAWTLEAIKQSVFALFPLLAPQYGVERAFHYALQNNPLYCESRKTPEWLLEKSPLFIWTGVPYVQYFLSLTHLLLRYGPTDAHLAALLSRSYSRFTLQRPSADAA